MSNNISDQTREVITDVNFQTLEKNKGSRYQQTQLAESRKTTLAQTTGKDVVLPANPKGNTKTDAKEMEESSSPKLPYPGAQFGGFQKKKEVSMIALMGKVLALQAKTNSHFWSTMWKQASQSMLMEVKFAPVIGHAVKNAYEEQSKATKAQAEQSFYTGLTSLIVFGAGLFMGTLMEYKDEASGIQQGDNEFQNKTGDTDKNEEIGNESVEGKGEQVNLNDDVEEDSEVISEDDESEKINLEAEIQEEGEVIDEENEDKEIDPNKNTDEATAEINKDNDGAGKKAERVGKKISDKASQFSKKLSSWWGKTFQVMMGMDMLQKGINGVAFEKLYQDKISVDQGQEGIYQALSKEAEQYAQFYGQAFSRQEDLRQGGQQNIDYAMSILKSASDTMASTVASMFRG
ncbi:MAG: hypothetical protein K940chlam9_00379 [Chlamydiae bacterium]|nr:hypothetical protein [Chlamydiota bacterium]